jgi:hypothetical protein
MLNEDPLQIFLHHGGNNATYYRFVGDDLTECLNALTDAAERVNRGDLSDVEAILTAQSVTLNIMFAELTRRATLNMGEYLDAADRYMRLALKAQGQCRATIETLAVMKNPAPVFAKQANIAHGPQQVNNAGHRSPTCQSCPRARKIKNPCQTNYWRPMANGWTTERRRRQAEAIRRWQPSEHSTGPRSVEGKARSARNAYRGGHRRRWRELVKSLNAGLRAQRETLSRI